MSAMQRNKGAGGERELAALLRDHLGVTVNRNLRQTRDGGEDLIIEELPGISLECKRAATPHLAGWWRQTVEQAGERVPILAYRIDRRPWRFVVPLALLGIEGGQGPGLEWTAELSLEGFCLSAREAMPFPQGKKAVIAQNDGLAPKGVDV
ncbi:MAG: hypothetical protein HQL56_16405 [Magnetococcales bacterium]|nr:hypothetical protein [Magnetococcales bacterium]